ncbi:MAG: autotransporter assembly complex family protein [Alphaproteobacteria bacterium]
MPYRVVLVRPDGAPEGLLDSDPLLEVLRQASELVALQDRVPQTDSALQSRIDTDRERMARVLRAEGYYDGTVDIAAAPPAGEDGTRQVTVTVNAGQRYGLRSFAIDNAYPPGTAFPIAVALDDIGIAIGDPATGEAIVGGQDRLVGVLADRGRPLAQVVDRMVVADHAAHAVDVTLTVDAGPEATFGPVAIEGLDAVEAALIRQRIGWREGEPYDQAAVDETRTTLAQLDVFGAVSIEPATDWVDADGRLPMLVRVTERAHRTIGGGLSYATSEGAGGQVYWQHRNLFGQAERLELRLAGTQRLVELAAEYRDNALLADPRYTVTAGITLDRERREGYSRRSLEAATGIAYALDDEITLSGGVRLAAREVDEEERGRDRFTLVGLPLALDYDLRDDAFNPTEGGLTRLTVEPLYIAPDPSLFALRASLRQTGYWAPLGDDGVVLAGWAEVGSIVGVARDTMPADERFYVGGGGSVRGYAYQFAGDIDDDGDPLGGQSMAAVGAEARFRFLEDFGAVLFIEGGRSFADSVPTFDRPLLWGAGAGARYFTDFGPLRLDVAVPLNRRAGVDDGFQLYISFGQAF